MAIFPRTLFHGAQTVARLSRWKKTICEWIRDIALKVENSLCLHYSGETCVTQSIKQDANNPATLS